MSWANIAKEGMQTGDALAARGIWQCPSDSVAPGTEYPEDVQHLVLMVGMPGAGKSESAKDLVSRAPGWTLVSSDHVFRLIDQREDYSLGGSNFAVVDEAVKSFARKAFSRGDHVVMDRCHFTPDQRIRSIHPMTSTGRRRYVTALCLDVNPAVCLQRIVDRSNHPTLQGPSSSSGEERVRQGLHAKLRTPGKGEGVDRVVWVDSPSKLEAELTALSRGVNTGVGGSSDAALESEWEAALVEALCVSPILVEASHVHKRDFAVATRLYNLGFVSQADRNSVIQQPLDVQKPNRLDGIVFGVFSIISTYLTVKQMRMLFQACPRLWDEPETYQDLFGFLTHERLRTQLLLNSIDLDLLFRGMRPRDDVTGTDADLYIGGSTMAQVMLGEDWGDTDVDLYTTAENAGRVQANLMEMGLVPVPEGTLPDAYDCHRFMSCRFMGILQSWATVAEEVVTQEEYDYLQSGAPYHSTGRLFPLHCTYSVTDPLKIGMYKSGRVDSETGVMYGMIMQRKVVDLLTTAPAVMKRAYESRIKAFDRNPENPWPFDGESETKYWIQREYKRGCQQRMMKNALKITRPDQLIDQSDFDICKVNYDGVNMRTITKTKPGALELDLWGAECFADDLWWFVAPPNSSDQNFCITEVLRPVYSRHLERAMKYKQRGVKLYPRDGRAWSFSLGYTPDSKIRYCNEIPLLAQVSNRDNNTM